VVRALGLIGDRGVVPLIPFSFFGWKGIETEGETETESGGGD
jgi:hypothetical protein